MKNSAAPAISRLHHNNNLAEIAALSKSISRWCLYTTMPLLLFVLFNANGVITVFFGKEYSNGSVPLLILTAGQCFYVAFGIIDQVLLMTGRQKEWLAISTIVFLPTFILDAIFIPKFHLLGSSIVSSTMILLL